ncbi:unnamed protein product [marine sediment metagenome]|uniref:Uncharacterized protein n=1 Tax=marine sediment metagenome TaxID=412755 RepID=X1L5Q4_9ZZZZ
MDWIGEAKQQVYGDSFYFFYLKDFSCGVNILFLQWLKHLAFAINLLFNSYPESPGH